MSPFRGESLSTFLLRFISVSERPSIPSSILECGLSYEAGFKILNIIMSRYVATFDKWVKSESHTHYNAQATRMPVLDLTVPASLTHCTPSASHRDSPSKANLTVSTRQVKPLVANPLATYTLLLDELQCMV